jgi:hypothetical protein
VWLRVLKGRQVVERHYGITGTPKLLRRGEVAIACLVETTRGRMP